MHKFPRIMDSDHGDITHKLYSATLETYAYSYRSKILLDISKVIGISFKMCNLSLFVVVL